jgi:hypothetical protein
MSSRRPRAQVFLGERVIEASLPMVWLDSLESAPCWIEGGAIGGGGASVRAGVEGDHAESYAVLSHRGTGRQFCDPACRLQTFSGPFRQNHSRAFQHQPNHKKYLSGTVLRLDRISSRLTLHEFGRRDQEPFRQLWTLGSAH